MTQLTQKSSVSALLTSGWESQPLVRTSQESETVFLIRATVKIPVSANHSALVSAKTASELARKYEMDPRKAAAMARARARLAEKIDSEPALSLTKLRLSKGLSQAKLAERMGVAQPHIARLERGEDAKTSTVVKLARALEVPAAEAFVAVAETLASLETK